MSVIAASGGIVGKAAPVSSIIAAAYFAILGFANPEKRKLKNIRGYLILDQAILRYEDNLITLEQLHDARERAESIIHSEKVRLQ